MGKIERKYLAHYIDASFNSGTPNYVRLGKDLEEYNEELNPDVEVKKNILGEQSVTHNGYEVSSDTDPYYAEYDEALTDKLFEIANERLTGDKVMTTCVDVLLKEENGGLTPVWAYREDCAVIPNSVGGDTSGVQIPFTVYNAGNRVAGSWNMTTKKFTETVATGGSGSGTGGSGTGTGN